MKKIKIEYIPELSAKEIEENHKHFRERISLYQKRGLDFVESRKFILEKAGFLNGSILEIGVGSGYTAVALAKAGYRFVSIDNDKESLKTAGLNLAAANILSNVKFYIMDGKFLSFENGSFNNVVAVNLFHHINNVDKMLAEIDRVVRANGKIVLADFNKKGMKIVEAVHRQEGRIHENTAVMKDDIYSYFHGLGYDIKNYEDKCHWILIGRK